ncbi:zinc knuckle [Cooperia oncophora]
MLSNGKRPSEIKTSEKKCFNCLKHGHIVEQCPQRTRGKRIHEDQERKEILAEDGISSTIKKARSMGVREVTPLVGRRSRWARISQTRVPALLDTGSMISIIPVGVEDWLEQKTEVYDVDSLESLNRRRCASI